MSTVATEERVVYHGWLHLLKSKGGVRQWKTVWAVLRPKSLALYKNEEEYAALLIMPFPSIIDAVDIEMQSKTKKFCMQVITEDRNYRFCAMGEEELSKWLGAFKSLLIKRKEVDAQREKERKELDALEDIKLAGKGKKENTVTFHEEGSSKAGIGTEEQPLQMR